MIVFGLISTAMPYSLYFRGLAEVDAGTAVVLAFLEPLTGAMLAAAILMVLVGAARNTYSTAP